jgi:hypothetical protein
MWCLTLTNGARSFHATKEAAEAAAAGAEHIVWYDAFNYEAHNPDAVYERRIAHERNLGLAYVGTLLDGLCRTLGLNPSIWRQRSA